MPSNPGCTLCPLHETTTNVCIWGNGDPEASLMIIGEAPGAEEEQLGYPFVGSSGKLLDESLAKAGVLRTDIYVSNVCKCRPPGNRRPTGEEMLACASIYLLQEIEEVDPHVILLLGNTPLTLATGEGGITRKRGRCATLPGRPWEGRQVIATYHPAYIRRNIREKGTFEKDVLTAVEASGILVGRH